MATERLRKRLDDGQGSSSNNVNENFCLIGTPLPNLDSKKRDPNEFKPIWQQEVYDEQGRRRFHGAFTGGYSAGYYNTVGSKEGWQPSNFRSSRKDKERNKKDGDKTRTKYKQSTAEDFMDEEDLQSYRDGRGALKANDEFLGQPTINDDRDLGRDPLMGLLGVQKEETNSKSKISIQTTSLGTRLLQRMGWKEGQGLGAWLSLDRLRRLRTLLGLPFKEAEIKESSSNLYPPPDTAMTISSPSHIGSQGLGWENAGPPSTLSELLKRQHSTAHENDPKSNRPQGGFGIGALEDDSDDEGEVYSTGHRMQDSTLVQRTKQVRSHKSEGDQKQKKVASVDFQNNEKKERWHDGTPLIPGFILSSEVVEEESDTLSITVPKDWQPDPNRVWKDASIQSRREPISTSSHRASMFGEAKIPGPPPSITDYLSEKDRERLEKAKLATKTSSISQSVAQPIRDPIIPTLDPEIAKAALQGFIPFENDKEKQVRYSTYLQAQVNQDNSLRIPDGQSIEEFERELREFSRSAAIFKPMNTMMASRFETALKSDQSNVKQMEPGLNIPAANDSLPTTDQSGETGEENESSYENMTRVQRNAKMGLFGPDTTRETKKWIPERLLCKRFNVPHPFPEEMATEDVTSVDKSNEVLDGFGESKRKRKDDITDVNARWEASKRQLQQLAANRSWENHSKEGLLNKASADSKSVEETLSSDNLVADRKDDIFDFANVGLGDFKDDKDESSYVKPSIEVFKFIFADGEQMLGDEERSAEETATDKAPSKLLFKPRKRPIIENAEGDQNDATSKKKKSLDRSKSNKGQIRGSLTFNMEEDEDETGFQLKKSKAKDNDLSKPATGRLKASDLFDN